MGIQTLAVKLVRDDEGTPDKEEFLRNASEAFDLHMAQRELENGQVAQVLSSIFDDLKGAGGNVDHLKYEALRRLDATSANLKTMSKTILSYIQENASSDRADGKLFRIGRGKGATTRRWADVPVEEDKKKKD